MPNEIQFLLYNLPDNRDQLKAVIKNESLWLTQRGRTQLFGVDRNVITKHLKNIFETDELEEFTVCTKIVHTALTCNIKGIIFKFALSWKTK